MAECSACGARVSPDEHFCGNCGTHLIPSSADFRTMSATLEDEVDVRQPVEAPAPAAAREPSGSLETAVVDPASTGGAPISSDSLGGSFTDSVKVHGTSTPKESTTGGHRPAVKQLGPATGLNGRYEIVRRIGGGG